MIHGVSSSSFSSCNNRHALKHSFNGGTMSCGNNRHALKHSFNDGTMYCGNSRHHVCDDNVEITVHNATDQCSVMLYFMRSLHL